MECPGAPELRALAEARVEPVRMVRVVEHLLGCARCRAIAFPDTAVVIADTEPARGGPTPSLNDPAVTEEAPGRYQLVRELGRGGQAKVFVAFDHHLGREVAMKLPHLAATSSPSQQAQTVLRFLREARLTARLEHPNIVPIHEIGRRADGSYYCTQRLIRPSQDASRVRTLRAAFSEARTPAERLLLLPNFVAVCNAVAHAHTRGVLHRDLKPDNVVIGALGETVVLDWGLGRLQGDSSSEPGVPPLQSGDGVVSLVGDVMGTPSYMSPEQALGAHAQVDARSDVWSLGAILYELLTGAPPFFGPTAMAVVAQVKTQDVVPVLQQAPETPRALAAVAMQALQRQPELRYATAQALAAEVSAWLADLPVRAYRYSRLEQLKLIAARNKKATAIALIAVVLLGVASAFIFRNYLRARSALAEVFVSKARVAEARLEWDAAAAYFAAARVNEDRADARLGAMLAANRAELPVRRLQGHSASVFALARSPDGRTLASGSFDRTARLWDVASGKTLRILAGHSKTVTALAFSPDGRWLVTASEDNTARLWDLDAGTAGEVIATSAEAFNAAAFSPDSQRVLLGGEDRRLHLASIADRSIVSSDAFDGGPDTHHGPIYAVGFLADGQQVLSGSWDHSTRFWSADGGFHPLAKLSDHTDSVLALRVSPDGRELATASRDGTALLYQLADTRTPAVLEGHEQKVYAVDFSPDGRMIASAGTDRSVRLWLAGAHPKVYGGPTWRSLVSASWRGDHEVSALVFLDPTHVASAGFGGDIVIRQLEALPDQKLLQRIDSIVTLRRSGRLLHPQPGGFALRPIGDFDPRKAVVHPLGERTHAGAVSVSPDEKTLAGRCDYNRLCWLDLESLKGLGGHTFPAGEEVLATAFSPDGSWVAVVLKPGLAIFDARTRLLTTTLPADTHGVFGAEFSPDSTLLATAGYDKTIKLWSTTTWQQLRVLEGHEHGIRRVAFSPDGKLLASASFDRSVRLWDPVTGRAIAELRGHLDQICAVAFSPDGELIASGGWDGTVRLWSARTHEELATWVSDEGRVWSIVFAPDGKSLYYGGLRVHRLEFKPLASPAEALRKALEAGGYRLEGPRLVR